MIKFTFVLLVAVLVGVPSIASSKDFGNGRFVQIYAADGTPVMQIDAEDNVACIQEASSSSSELEKNNLSVVCSGEDRSFKFPVNATVYSPITRKQITIHIFGMENCLLVLRDTPFDDIVMNCRTKRVYSL